MSTNTDFHSFISDFESDLSGAAQALQAGLPDPRTLTQLANDLLQLNGFESEKETFRQILQTTNYQPQIPRGFSSFAPSGISGIAASNLKPEDKDLAQLKSLPYHTLELTAPLNGFDHSPLGGNLPSIPISTSDFTGGIFSQNLPPTPPAFSFLDGIRTLREVEKSVNPAIRQTNEKIGNPQQTSSVLQQPSLNGQSVEQEIHGIPVSPFLKDIRPLYEQGVIPQVGQEKQLDQGLPFDVPSTGRFFDVQSIRRDFPILQERVHGGKPLIWLDNAATTQKPKSVIDRIRYYYEHENSNVHRAAHTLAARSTDAYDEAREKVSRFLKASSSREIIFVRGATEGINLVAKSWGAQNIHEGDEIILSHLEHHANIVPWQMLCSEKGAKIKVAPVDQSGQIILSEYEKLFTGRTKLAAFTHVSNALGTITPVNEMTEIAKRHGVTVLVDGSQSVSHTPVDVQSIGCDFFVFSGHKVFAPTGIGAVYGKYDVIEHTQPWQGGGNMILDVTFEKTVYHPAPFKFEAGTGSIADAVGLGAALDYIERIGLHTIEAYEHDLLVYATQGLQKIPGLHLIGTAGHKASVLSFVLDGFANDQVGQALNADGIAVRTGHHCAQPILRRFGLESTVRPSLAFYNTCEEVDALISSIWNLKKGINHALS